MKEDLVLKDPRAPRTFTYDLALSGGLRPTVDRDGAVRVTDGKRTVFLVPRGVLFEQRDRTKVAAAPPYKLTRKGSAWRLTVSADSAWVRARDRAWPIVLDPSVDNYGEHYVLQTAGQENECESGAGNRFVCGAGQNPDPGAEDDPQVPLFEWANAGWNLDGFRRTYTMEDFPISVLPTSYTVTSAKLNVWLEDSGYGHAQGISMRAEQGLEVASLSHSASSSLPSANARTPLRPLPVAKGVFPTGGIAKLDVTSEVRQWLTNLWDFDHAAGRPQIGFGVRVTDSPQNVVDSEEAGCRPDTQTDFCDQLITRIATSLNSDVDKRPYLDVHQMPPAEIGSEVRAPIEGHLTSRFVELQASASNTGVTSATFEYTTGTSRDWTVIPASALRYWDDGAQPTSDEIPTPSNGSSSKLSRSLIWDLNKTPGAETDGPIHVRALLDAGLGAGGGVTPERNFRLDRKNPETSTTEDVGPAEIDLLTGDANVTETDADVKAFLDDLTLTRTYHSRGGSPRATDMFGPGWTSSFEVDGGEMPYKSIYDFTEVDETQELVDFNVFETGEFWDSYDEEYGTFDFATLDVDPVYETVRYETRYAVLEKADGSKISFRQSGSDWVPDNEHSDLVIDEVNVGGQRTFTVKDPDGGLTKFGADSPGSPNYRPSEYAQAGSGASTTFQHEVVAGRKRLRRVLAPAPAGVNCPTTASAPWVAGCRALELVWSPVTVGDRTEQRVTSVKLRAIDPSGTVPGDSVTIAQYEYDGSGRLKKVSDPRTATGLPTEYDYDSEGRLQTYTPAGERAWSFAYQSTPGDDGNGRVRSITRKTPAGNDATTTFVYDVPLSGAGAPHDMSPAAVAAWAQRDLPRTATAVFPPDTVPPTTGLPSSWARATVHYLAAHGKAVNVVDPEGNTSTTAFNSRGKITRELTPRNRERALAVSGSTSDRSELLDTQSTYAANGVDLINTTGPEHEIRRPNGSSVAGRERVTYSYDELKPSGAAFEGEQHLVTRTQKGTRISSTGTTVDIETTTNAYSDGANHRGWVVKQPLSTTVGSGAEAATTRFAYDATYPLLTGKRMPKAAGGDSHATVYSYYGIGTSPSFCSNAGAGLVNPAAAAGALCGSSPAAQPASGPDLTGTFFRYSLLWDIIEERKATDASSVPSSTLRTVVLGRDALGRENSRSISATTGRPIPTVTTAYSASTGRTTTTTSASIGSTPAASISRAWDDNGRLATYVDAEGGSTTYAYDLNGRETTIQDPRGTRSLSYDDRDLVSAVTDSTITGAITASRDADGELVEQTLPGGLKETRTINENGDRVYSAWNRATGCLSNCTWVESTVERDGEGRIVSHETLNSEQRYSFDTLGRLLSAEERRGTTCTQSSYAYDKNSNRVGETKSTAVSGAACGTGATNTTSNSYDGADRIKNTGYSYDSLGRTDTVPATSAPSGAATTLTHDADDLLATSAAGSTTQSLTRDPQRRLRTDTSAAVGLATSTSTLRYGGDDDAPTGKTRTSSWERYVTGVDGTQIAIVTDVGAATWELTDIKGDVVATAPFAATVPATKAEYGAFGSSAWGSGTVTPKGLTHAWLGGYGKHSSFQPGGFVQMGVRTYNPVSGRFLEVDPVDGGSANPYDYALQDPVNNLDLDGQWVRCRKGMSKNQCRVPSKCSVGSKTGACGLGSSVTNGPIRRNNRKGLCASLGVFGGIAGNFTGPGRIAKRLALAGRWTGNVSLLACIFG